MSSSHSNVSCATGSHLFSISSFSKLRKNGLPGAMTIMTSSSFSVGTFLWSIIFDPSPVLPGCEEYCSVYLQFLDESREAIAHVEFSIRDHYGGEIEGSRIATSVTFNAATVSSWGFPKFIERVSLEGSINDTVNILCQITVLNSPRVRKSNLIEVTKSDLTEGLGNLLQSKKGADITIRCGSTNIRANKCILAARSPVLRQQLIDKHNPVEIEIHGFDVPVIRAVLEHIYTDNLIDNASMDSKRLGEIMVAADHYKLEVLKASCQASLIANLEMDDVEMVLKLADRLQSLELREACVDFLC